jgi:hypothetical protein
MTGRIGARAAGLSTRILQVHIGRLVVDETVMGPTGAVLLGTRLETALAQRLSAGVPTPGTTGVHLGAAIAPRIIQSLAAAKRGGGHAGA